MRRAYPDPRDRPEPLFRRHLASTATATAHTLVTTANVKSAASRTTYFPVPLQSSQLHPAAAHSPAPPAASAPLDSPLASAASAPFNTLPPPAASVESSPSSAASHSCMPSTQGGYLQQVRSCFPDDYCDNAVPPRKEVNGKENNLWGRKSLSQCKKDPGGIYARCSLARCIPQPPGLTSLLVSEV